MKHWTNVYIGIPVADHGRDRLACDCWGLIRLVYAECKGIALPSYGEEYADTTELAQLEAVIGSALADDTWIAVEQPRAFDVAVFRRGRIDSHVGLVIDNRRMLHAATEQSKIESYRSGPWSHRLTGIYRHRTLA